MHVGDTSSASGDGTGSAATSIRLQSLTDEVARNLQQAIMSGELRPGDHLQQEALCARFSLSRTPIREALQKLQAQGLIEIIPNRGARVRVPTRTEILQLYELRAELEGFACELAAARTSKAELAALQRSVSQAREATERLRSGLAGPTEEDAIHESLRQAAAAFHAAIYDASGNAVLAKFLHELSDRFPRDYAWRALRRSEDVRDVEVEHHERLVAALEAGDGKLARELMTTHMRAAGERLVGRLNDNEFWASRAHEGAQRREKTAALPS